jgi:hypothetical protein
MRLLPLLEEEQKSSAIWYVIFRQSPKLFVRRGDRGLAEVLLRHHIRASRHRALLRLGELRGGD